MIFALHFGSDHPEGRGAPWHLRKAGSWIEVESNSSRFGRGSQLFSIADYCLGVVDVNSLVPRQRVNNVRQIKIGAACTANACLR